MAKGAGPRQTNSMIDQQYAQNQQEHTEDRTRNNAWADENHNRQSETYNTLSGGLTNFANTGGLDDATRERMRALMLGSGGVGGGGGAGLEGLYGAALSGGTMNVDRMRSAIPKLTELMNTGGYDPNEKAAIMTDIGGLRTMGHDQYAGISAEDIARMRGNGLFQEYTNTGGFSDADKTMMRARGTANIPSAYSGMQNEVNRLAQVGNNSAPNKAAMMSRLSRNAARDMQGAALDTELGITDRVQANKKWGAEGSAQSESGIQNLVIPAKQNSLNSAIENSRGIQEFMSAMSLQSGLGISDIEAQVESMLAGERRWGAQGLESSAARGASNANAAAANNRDMLGLEKYFLEYGNDNRMAGLAGLGGLQGGLDQQNSQYLDRSLDERGLTSGTGLGAADLHRLNNPAFDWNAFAGNVLGAGAGIAAPWLNRPQPVPRTP